MAMGLFLPGLDTLEDVIEIRTKAINFLKEGTSVMSWTSEGSSVTKQFTLPVRTVIEECNAYLQTVDSGSYGRRVTRTNPSFNY